MRFRRIIPAFLLFVFGLPLWTPAQTTKPLSNAVILIVRHAEKPADGTGLTLVGEERARRYVGFFEHYRVSGRPLVFSHIFAASDSRSSMRPRLTVTPLAMALHMKLDQRFSDDDPAGIAREAMTSDHGREILICWRHKRIPPLLEALGIDPAPFVPGGKWPGDIYDRVIELHFNSSGRYDPKASKLVLEHLMPGDESTLPTGHVLTKPGRYLANLP